MASVRGAREGAGGGTGSWRPGRDVTAGMASMSVARRWMMLSLVGSEECRHASTLSSWTDGPAMAGARVACHGSKYCYVRRCFPVQNVMSRLRLTNAWVSIYSQLIVVQALSPARLSYTRTHASTCTPSIPSTHHGLRLRQLLRLLLHLVIYKLLDPSPRRGAESGTTRRVLDCARRVLRLSG